VSDYDIIVEDIVFVAVKPDIAMVSRSLYNNVLVGYVYVDPVSEP
jgi:hypothetical protein